LTKLTYTDEGYSFKSLICDISCKSQNADCSQRWSISFTYIVLFFLRSMSWLQASTKLRV